jgi:hypothetical protein
MSDETAIPLDDAFFDRADAHIQLSNSQAAGAGRDVVSASTLYAAARFNAHVVALGCVSVEEMTADRAGAIEYFVRQYQLMLEENLDDYIRNFGPYVGDKRKRPVPPDPESST